MTNYLDALRVMLARAEQENRVAEFLEAIARITLEATTGKKESAED